MSRSARTLCLCLPWLLLACGNSQSTNRGDSNTGGDRDGKGAPRDRVEAPAKRVVQDNASVRFAVVGDFGKGDSAGHEKVVADMINAWDAAQPLQFVLSLGDNNYHSLDTTHYERYVCADTRSNTTYYAGFVNTPADPNDTVCTGTRDAGVSLSSNPAGNRFFPVPGNHDWGGSGSGTPPYCTEQGVGYSAYASFFPWAVAPNVPADKAQGKDLFYEFHYPTGIAEPLIQFYAFNANCAVADNNNCAASASHGCPIAGSGDCANQYDAQAFRIEQTQSKSAATWSLVYMHQGPYGASRHPGCDAIKDIHFEGERFRNAMGYGMTALLSGHAHDYERYTSETNRNFPFFINGAGGQELDTCDPSKVTADMSSAVCLGQGNSGFVGGAMLVTATRRTIVFDFYAIDSSYPDGHSVDSCTLTRYGKYQELSCKSSLPYMNRNVCQPLTSCANVAGGLCGYCADDGRLYAMSGGQPANVYCKNWITNAADCPAEGSCGAPNKGQRCPVGQCCNGETLTCGTDEGSCGAACLPAYGDCGACEHIQVCSDIQNSDCGWCNSDGKAYLGDKNGSWETPCSDWTWYASDCVTAGMCGPKAGSQTCNSGNCCSSADWCGTTSEHCDGNDCQLAFGDCGMPATP